MTTDPINDQNHGEPITLPARPGDATPSEFAGGFPAESPALLRILEQILNNQRSMDRVLASLASKAMNRQPRRRRKRDDRLTDRQAQIVEVVLRVGSLVGAADELHVESQTISAAWCVAKEKLTHQGIDLDARLKAVKKTIIKPKIEPMPIDIRGQVSISADDDDKTSCSENFQ